MIEPIDTVITKAAVRGPRRPEDFAREAVLELHRLALDEDLLGAGRRPVRRRVERVWHFDLLLDVGRFVLGGPRDDARIAERRAEQRAHGEHKQDAADDRDGRGDALRQKGTVEGEKQPTGSGDEHYGKVKHPRIGGSHKVTVAVELVSTSKDFPLFRRFLTGCHLRLLLPPLSSTWFV